MNVIMKLTRRSWFLGILICVFAAVVLWNIPVEKRKYGFSQNNVTTDYTGLLPEQVARVVIAGKRTELQKIVQEANVSGQSVSIAGLQHSQGGHTYYKNGLVIDMRTFNNVLNIDEKAKTIKVEGGATWEDVQDAISPYGLALKVTQSQTIFTLGGSLSVNAHGRDIRFGPMASTVKEMTLLTPTGEIKTVARGDSDDWTEYVLGGYGLFGVILDVTLELTENERYTIQTEEVNINEYESYFTNLLANKNTAMHYARISVAPSTFLDEMYVINYNYTGKTDLKTKLKREQAVRFSKLMLDLGRRGGFLSDLFWETQKLYIQSIDGNSINRNNAMRSESTFMEFTKPGRVEVLQEFFIPIHSYEDYMREVKKLLLSNDKNDDFNVLNITLRYLAKDSHTRLNYASEDMFGLVILIQHGLKEKEMANAETVIQNWTSLTNKYGGTYYLPYYRYQTKEQFRNSYPDWENFREEKVRRDPNEIFQNLFYNHYIK